MTLSNRSPDIKPLGDTMQTEFFSDEKTQLEDLWRSLSESIIGRTSAGFRIAQPDLMMTGIPAYFDISSEASACRKEAFSALLISRIIESNPNIIVIEFGLHRARRAINTDKDSPDVTQSDIDRFYMLKGDTLLTLDFFHKNIPSASVENGIDREIHIEWVSEDLEAFVSVWPECQTATFVGKNYISGEHEVKEFTLKEETKFSPIKSKVIDFFESI